MLGVVPEDTPSSRKVTQTNPTMWESMGDFTLLAVITPSSSGANSLIVIVIDFDFKKQCTQKKAWTFIRGLYRLK